MPNSVKIQNILVQESLAILNNEYKPLLNSFHRDLEAEFNTNVNGYKLSDTVTMRRPADFTVRSGAVRAPQDIVEGSVNLKIDQQTGVDFDLTSKELTLDIEDRAGVNGLRERVIKPAMINLVNDLLFKSMNTFYQSVPNWVGTPGQLINSFSDFTKGPERLDEMTVPTDARYSALSVSDYYALLGSQTNLFIEKAAGSAYRSGVVGEIAGIGTFMTQIMPTHTVGPLGGAPLINGGAQGTTFAVVKDTWIQNLVTDGWSLAVSNRLKAGDVLTFPNVFMVNAKTKQSTGILSQHVVMVDASSDVAGNLTAVISPPLITSGPHQNVTAAPADNAVITVMGAANTQYKQNLFYHKNAFALAVVPMVIPPGSIDFARGTQDGISIRIGPVYDGTNDKSGWRMDMLWGVKTIDSRLATRASGTP